MQPSREKPLLARLETVSDRPPLSRGRTWAFRIAATILAPLVFCGLLEIGLRLSHYGYLTEFFLRSKVGGARVWVENQRFGWRFFSHRIARAPGTLKLNASKPPKTCRIFVFGESAAYGDPDPSFGFSRHLDVLLRERFQGVRFEVVNVAMTAINSHTILPIARECAAHEGDLWVVYAGNNEVVGPYGSGTAFSTQAPPLAFVRASIAIKTTRTGQLLDDLIDRAIGSRGGQQSWFGMEMMQSRMAADNPRLSRTYSHFRRNLEDIVQAGIQGGAKVVLCTVACNLKDCAPFASVNRSDVTPSASAAWASAFRSGLTAETAGRSADAAEFYRKAGQLDGGHAETMFRWGRCELALSNNAEASALFTKARDLDALRFRADSRENAIIRETASHWGIGEVLLVDAERVFNSASSQGIAGEDLFYEHVHLNSSGNYLLARSVAEGAVGLVPVLANQTPTGNWLTQQDCLERLAFTDWNRLGTAELLRERISHPPFTSQCDHAEGEARLSREISLLRSRMTPSALAAMAETYRRAIATAPQDWVLEENLARLLADAGAPEGAATASQQVVDLVPHRTEGWSLLGLSLVKLGKTADATQALNQALRLRPGDAGAIYGLGCARLREQRFAEAAELFVTSLRSRPASEDAQVGLGEAYAGLGDTAKALAHYREALALNPANSVAQSHLLALLDREGKLSEKIPLLQRAAAMNPRDALTRLELGRALWVAGRQAEAAPQFAEAVDLDPQIADAHYYLGLVLAREERFAQAQSHFAAAVRLKPEDLDAHLNYGVSLARSGDFALAIAEFQTVLRLQPENSMARKYLEMARNRLDQSRQANRPP